MGEKEDIRHLIDLVMDTACRHFGVPREMMPIELEEVVRKALFEANKIGKRRRRTTQPFDPPSED